MPLRAKQAFGGRAEVLVSLETQSLAVARVRFGEQLKQFERTLARATGRPDPTAYAQRAQIEPNRTDIEVAVRAWVRDRVDRRPNAKGDASARLKDLERQAKVALSGFEFGHDRANLQTQWIAETIRDTRRWSLAEGSEGFDYLLRLVARAQVEATQQEADEITNRPRIARDLTFTPEEYRLDAVRVAEAQASAPVPLMTLFDRYCAEAKPAPASVKAAKRYLRAFIAHVGHDNAAKVKAADVIGWKDKLVADPLVDGRPRSPKTINDGYLTSLKTVLGWGVENRIIDANPAAGVRVRAPKMTILREKGLRDAEALLVLKSALLPVSTGTSPEHALARRWVPWVCAYSGARVNEITQLRAEDVLQVDGVWCIRITPEAGSVKNRMARTVPLHSHLIDQGFLRAIEGKTGPLFYNPARHRGGSDGNPQYKKVGERLAEWVRDIGVDDPNVAPNHGWRHRFKTAARGAGIDAETRDAIQGHRARTEGEEYGHFPVSVLAEAIEKLPRYKVPSVALPPARKRIRPTP